MFSLFHLCYNKNMKIIRTIKITNEQFYDYLEQQLIEDIKNSQHKKISASDIQKGLKYKKEDAQSKLVTEIYIQQYVRDECYRFKVIYMSDSTSIEYRTKPVDEGLQITMTQHIQSFEEKRHHKLSRHFHEAIYLSRMTQAIYDIENTNLNIK